MNASYDFNSTPLTINRTQYIESLMDFSTPMSTISNRETNNNSSKKLLNEKITSDDEQNLIRIHDDNNNEIVVDKLLQKIHEHKTHFQKTKTYLTLLDLHLHEITTIVKQIQCSLDENSSIKLIANRFEMRLLQMSTKREQIRTAINNLSQSPTINQTLNDIIEQISPSKSNSSLTNDPFKSYAELIDAIKLSLNQKLNLIEHLQNEQKRLKHRTIDYQHKSQQQQQLITELLEKLVQQQSQNEKYIEKVDLNKPLFGNHNEQLNEFNRLSEEYQILQDENRLLKNKTKENIKNLYTFINQWTD